MKRWLILGILMAAAPALTSDYVELGGEGGALLSVPFCGD